MEIPGNGPQEKVFVAGPTSLSDYLDLRSEGLSNEISRLIETQQQFLSNKEGIGFTIKKTRQEWETIEKAREALANGDKEAGLEILRAEIDKYKDRIKFNKESGYEQGAQDNNEVLIVLQMLLAHETGEEPGFYGYSVSRQGEAYYMPESVQGSDLVNATLFKAMMAFGSYHPPSSGYYPTPDSISPEHTINQLFGYNCGLTEEEKETIINQLSTINNSIKGFAKSKFAYRYERSLPRFPNSDMKPQELITYHSYNAVSESPNAAFYMEGNQIKCRYSKDKKMEQRVFDIAQPADGIELETVSEIKALPEGLQSKVLDVLRSHELKKRWEELAPRTMIPEILSY